MTRSEAARLMLVLFEALPHSRKGPLTSEVYESMILDLDFGICQSVIVRLIATCQWLPTIRDIRRAYSEQVGGVRSGAEAWGIVLQAVRRVGRYSTPQFADPLITRAVAMFGSWEAVCNSPEDDPAGRARFIDLYDRLQERRIQQEASGIPLPEYRTGKQVERMSMGDVPELAGRSDALEARKR